MAVDSAWAPTLRQLIRELLPEGVAGEGGDGGEDHEWEPGGEGRVQPAAGAERLAAQYGDHENGDDGQAQADGNEWVAVGTRDDKGQADE